MIISLKQIVFWPLDGIKTQRNFKLARAVVEDLCLALFLEQSYNELTLIFKIDLWIFSLEL